jgi:hypothetical protein
MPTTKPALEEVSGYLGVGSLQLLGAFFIIDAYTGFFTLVELYAKSTAVAILFTVPLLVISYVLGMLSSLAVEVALERAVRPHLTAELFATALRTGKEPLIARYIEVERHSRLLHGCTRAFLLLAFGFLAERVNMSTYSVVGTVCFIIGIGIAILCPFLARRLQSELKRYVVAAARGDA